MPTISEAFGIAVARRRRAMGISQEEFGDRAALDRTYVSGVERGLRNPTLAVIVRMSTVLGLSVSELLRLAESVVEGEVSPETSSPVRLLPWRKRRPAVGDSADSNGKDPTGEG